MNRPLVGRAGEAENAGHGERTDRDEANATPLRTPCAGRRFASGSPGQTGG
jgi:hypothetical protein